MVPIPQTAETMQGDVLGWATQNLNSPSRVKTTTPPLATIRPNRQGKHILFNSQSSQKCPHSLRRPPQASRLANTKIENKTLFLRAWQNLTHLGNQLKQGTLPNTILWNTAIRSTLYAGLVHGLYTTQINSISAGDPLPNFRRMSARGLAPCALRNGLEYAVAMGTQRTINQLLPGASSRQHLNNPQSISAKVTPLLPLLTNALSSLPATVVSLMTERFNQHLILGKTPQQAFHAIYTNPGDALRGFPVAALGLTLVLTIQNSRPNTTETTNTGNAIQKTPKPLKKQSKQTTPLAASATTPAHKRHSAALNMAALGSVGGLVDYTIGNAQLRGISSAEAFKALSQQKLATLAAYSALGALTLALYQTTLDLAQERFIQKQTLPNPSGNGQP